VKLRAYRGKAVAPAQRGFALIAFISLIVLMSVYLLVRQLNASAGFTADRRNHNAKVLNQAKLALIGYVAQHAALASEDDPGRLPCPEAAGYYGDPAQEGIAAPFCTLPAVGRLPWRTLGQDKLTDAAAEPLWYVVSAGWALPSSAATLTINSNTTGQLTVDGVASAAVALIIAPGAAFTPVAATGCTAWTQLRPVTGPPDLRNYLECENATSPADANFVTTGPSTSFDDQVLRVTTADLLPGIEAAIAVRIQREIVPGLKAVYASAQWGLSATNPVFAFAAPFADPGPGAGTSDFRGVAGTFQGLLPFNQTQGCAVSAANPRCLPSPLLVDWSAGPMPASYMNGGYGSIDSQSCSWQPSGSVKDFVECQGVYREDGSNPSQRMRIEMQATFSNVAMGLRAIDATRMYVEARNNSTGGPWLPVPPPPPPAPPSTPPLNYTTTMNPNGSVTITFGGWLHNIDAMGWGTIADFRIRLERAVIADHPLLDATTVGPGSTGWFVRNEWYRLVYYALSPRHAASGTAPRSCENTTPTCLSVTNVIPTNKQRAILILAGRSLANPPPVARTLADFVEFGNADGNLVFEQQPVSRAINAALKKPFNDRIIVLDANP
jgi:hypothetical protein